MSLDDIENDNIDNVPTVKDPKFGIGIFLVLLEYDLYLEHLFLTFELTQKYQKCHLLCYINGTVISFSINRELIGLIFCYIKVFCIVGNEKMK